MHRPLQLCYRKATVNSRHCIILYFRAPRYLETKTSYSMYEILDCYVFFCIFGVERRNTVPTVNCKSLFNTAAALDRVSYHMIRCDLQYLIMLYSSSLSYSTRHIIRTVQYDTMPKKEQMAHHVFNNALALYTFTVNTVQQRLARQYCTVFQSRWTEEIDTNYHIIAMAWSIALHFTKNVQYTFAF